MGYTLRGLDQSYGPIVWTRQSVDTVEYTLGPVPLSHRVRQQRILDMDLNTDITLHRADLPLCPEQQERSSSLVQEEPEPPQIKEEQEELLERPQDADGSTLTILVGKAWSYAPSEFLHLDVCKGEVSPEQQERSSNLGQQEPEPPQIKDEHAELLQRAEEADGSTWTLLAVKGEDDDENRETEPVASTSTRHIKTQADVEDCGTSKPSRDGQLLSSHRSESDTEDSDEWEETREDQSALNTPKSHKTHAEGQRLSLSNKLSQDLKSSKQTCIYTEKKMKSSKQTCIYTEKKIISCTECGKTFNHVGNLNRHTMIHTGERTFTCTVCSKSFNRKDKLKLHMSNHGEKPFTCTVCGKGFGQMSDLKVHMRVHTGEKPFTCTVCGKGFGHMGDLNTHMRIHTGEKPFMCTVCSTGFRQMVNLKTHMRIHTGEKPFMCTVCGKCFVQVGNLKTHMRIHTREKPFTCTVCSKGFGQMVNLKTHMRIHTGENPL